MQLGNEEGTKFEHRNQHAPANLVWVTINSLDRSGRDRFRRGLPMLPRCSDGDERNADKVSMHTRRPAIAGLKRRASSRAVRGAPRGSGATLLLIRYRSGPWL